MSKNKLGLFAFSIAVLFTCFSNIPGKTATPCQSDDHCKLMGHDGMVFCVSISSNGRYACSGGGVLDDGVAILWDLQIEKEVRRFVRGHLSRVRCVAMSKDDSFVVTGGSDGKIVVWDLQSGTILRSWVAHEVEVCSLAISTDGKSVLSGGHNKVEDNCLKLWSFANGQEIRRFVGHKGVVSCVALSKNGEFAVSGGFDRSVRIWHLATGTNTKTIAGQERIITSLALSPDDKTVLFGFGGRFDQGKYVEIDNYLSLCDVKTGHEICRFRGHASTVSAVAFGGDGTLAVSASGSKKSINDNLVPIDCDIRFWDVKARKESRIFRGHEGPITGIAVSQDDKTLLSSSVDGTIRLWHLNKK